MNPLAHGFLALGVAPGDRVLVLLPTSMVIARCRPSRCCATWMPSRSCPKTPSNKVQKYRLRETGVGGTTRDRVKALTRCT